MPVKTLAKPPPDAVPIQMPPDQIKTWGPSSIIGGATEREPFPDVLHGFPSSADTGVAEDKKMPERPTFKAREDPRGIKAAKSLLGLPDYLASEAYKYTVQNARALGARAYNEFVHDEDKIVPVPFHVPFVGDVGKGGSSSTPPAGPEQPKVLVPAPQGQAQPGQAVAPAAYPGAGGGYGSGGGGSGGSAASDAALAQTAAGPFDEQIERLRQVGEQQANQYKDLEQAHYDQARAVQAQADGQQAAAMDRAQELRDYQLLFAQTADDLARQKVDPGRWWGSKDTGEKISTGIGVILGSIGAGLRHSPNRVLDMIDREIDRDMDAQKTMLQAKQGQTQLAHTAFGMALQRMGDEKAAEDVARAAMLQKAKLELEGRAQPIAGTRAQLGIEELIAKLEEKRLEAVLRATKRAGAGGGGGGGMGGAPWNKQDSEYAWKYATETAQLQLPETRAAAQEVVDQYAEPGGEKGTGLAASYIYGKSPLLYQKIYGEEATAREQTWLGFKNVLLHKLSGAAVNPGEAVRLEGELEGAHDARSRVRAAQHAIGLLESQEQNLRAGLNPRVAALYDAQMAAQLGPRPQAVPPPPTRPVKYR